MFLEFENPDMRNFLKIPRWYMIRSGIWPAKNSKWVPLYYLYRYGFIWIYFLGYLICPLIFAYLHSDDSEAVSDALYIAISTSACFGKFISLEIKQKEYYAILESLDNPIFYIKQTDHRKIVQNSLKIVSFFTKLYYANINMCVLFFALQPLFNSKGEWILPLASYTPLNVKNSKLAYFATYFWQIGGTFLVPYIGLSIDVIINVIICIAYVQLKVLKDNLENAVTKVSKSIKTNNNMNLEYYDMLTNEENEKVKEILSYCVQHHQAILRLIEDIETAFNPGLFLVIAIDELSLCMIGLQLIIYSPFTVKFCTALLFFTAIAFQIFFYCLCGNQIVEESTTIADACYSMEWYRCNINVKNIIYIIMERSKRPAGIKAGIFLLTLNMFTILMKTTYQYFTVLRTTYDF